MNLSVRGSRNQVRWGQYLNDVGLTKTYDIVHLDINDDSEDTMSPQSRTATITVLLNDTLFIRLLILMNYSKQFWPVRSEYISHFSPTSYDLNFSAF